MKKILTATLAVAIALAPASAIAQGVITGQQSYVTGSKPDAEPGKYKVVKRKKAKAVHHKHSDKVAKAPPGQYKVVKIKKAKAAHHKHSYKVAKAPHYAKHSYYRPGHHHHYWHHSHHHWLLPALVGTVVGLGLFHYWH
jgi:hypothetical protein